MICDISKYQLQVLGVTATDSMVSVIPSWIIHGHSIVTAP